MERLDKFLNYHSIYIILNWLARLDQFELKALHNVRYHNNQGLERLELLIHLFDKHHQQMGRLD